MKQSLLAHPGLRSVMTEGHKGSFVVKCHEVATWLFLPISEVQRKQQRETA